MCPHSPRMDSLARWPAGRIPRGPRPLLAPTWSVSTMPLARVAVEIFNGPLLTASSALVSVRTLGTALHESAPEAVSGSRVVVDHHPTTRKSMVNAR